MYSTFFLNQCHVSKHLEMYVRWHIILKWVWRKKSYFTLRYDWNPKNAFEVDKVSQKMRFRFQMLRMLSYAYCGKCWDPIHLHLFYVFFFRNCHFLVCKIQEFFVTQILREINFGESCKYKTDVFCQS